MKLAGLLSGGKDSVYAAHLTQKQGHTLTHLVSLRSMNPDSYMFHIVNIDIERLHAQAWGGTRIPAINRLISLKSAPEHPRSTLYKWKKPYW